MWVGQQQLQQVMALVADSPQWKSTAVWMLAAYVFKLRVPSECLPMVVGIGDSSTYGQAQTSQSIIHIGESEIVLCLKTRKNRYVPVTQAIMSAFMLLCIRPWGARLCRSCWCKECGLTCPVHMLGAALNSWGPGSQPFAGTTAPKARANLREVLAAIGVPEASRYRTHDLKRGHTRDMANKGCTLKEILLAADWRCTCQCQLELGSLEPPCLPGHLHSQNISTWTKLRLEPLLNAIAGQVTQVLQSPVTLQALMVIQRIEAVQMCAVLHGVVSAPMCTIWFGWQPFMQPSQVCISPTVFGSRCFTGV